MSPPTLKETGQRASVAKHDTLTGPTNSHHKAGAQQDSNAQELVASFPPLTTDQADRVAVLLRGGTG